MSKVRLYAVALPLFVLLLAIGCAPKAPSVSQRLDADIGKATYRDYLVKYGSADI